MRETEAKYVITYYGRPIAVLLPVDEMWLGDVARRVAEATSRGDEAAAELEKLRQEIGQTWK
ncbi:MAG: hypothetical protein U9R72_10500 [Chloroflexota bacterium]|nr:hypothetical protein [Chloroflexota bacterium]